MKRKTTVILIFIVVIVVPSMTAEAQDRQNIEDDVQITEEPKLVSPNPFSEETKSESPLVIAPTNTDKQVDNPNSSIDKSNLLLSVGIPILSMICAAASTSIALFLLYKKK